MTKEFGCRMFYLGKTNGQWQVVPSFPYVTLKAKNQKPFAGETGDHNRS